MRKPNQVIKRDDGSVYLNRWHIIPRNRFVNLYLHQFLASDDDRALHDHPWAFLSWILKGQYFEHTPANWDPQETHVKLRKRWSFAYRPADWIHRIELDFDPEYCEHDVLSHDGNNYHVVKYPYLVKHEKPVWTLILTGPRKRAWGFHCESGWRHWAVFDKIGCE